jgi:hypothetical protein
MMKWGNVQSGRLLATFNHVTDLLVRHHRADWQGDDLAVERLGKRELQVAELLRISLLMMRGDRVVDRGMYA